MIENELDLVVKQIKYILTGKPITDEMRCKSPEYAELQSGLTYLADSINDANLFVENLIKSEFDNQVPLNFSVLNSNLKELNSVLKSLSYRANQIADGKLNRLENNEPFLKQFNTVVDTLSAHKNTIEEQTEIMDESVNLLKAIIDNVSDSVIVTDMDRRNILYLNNQAKKDFYTEGTSNFRCDSKCTNESCNLFEKILEHTPHKRKSTEFEYTCKRSGKHFRVHTYVVKWNDGLTYTHYISDVTKDKKILMEMEELAYYDELTKVHNRHYCTSIIREYLDEEIPFIFAIIDLDGLKYANDTFGHIAGDEYLKTVVSVLEEQFVMGKLCRIGGDEFAVVTNREKLRSVNDKLIRANNNLVTTADQYPMSFSFGAIEVNPELELTIEEVLSKADEIMYKQKNNKAYKRENKLGIF